MLDFQFYSPTEFVFGRGAEAQVGALVRKHGGSKVLLHYGGGSAERSGLLGRVRQSLEAAGVAFVELGGVKPNPRDTLVYEGIGLCRREQVDFLLPVGGGSVIDSAKAIAMGVPYEGDFWDFYSGKSPSAALPVGTVLTIAAAGSEGSGDTVITKEDGLLKRGAGSDLLRPRFSILDPELTCTLPPYQTACGITDIMAHVFERYFTPTTEVEITDRLCEAVLLTMLKEAPRVIADPSNVDARANILWAGTVAHTNLCGVGRAQDWNSHGIEHELSAKYDCAHGAGLAVIMPAWMTHCCGRAPARFAQMAERVFGVTPDPHDPEAVGREGIRRFRAFLARIGMPTTLAELGADPKDVPEMIAKLGLGEDGHMDGYVPLSPADVADIFRIAGEA